MKLTQKELLRIAKKQILYDDRKGEFYRFFSSRNDCLIWCRIYNYDGNMTTKTGILTNAEFEKLLKLNNLI